MERTKSRRVSSSPTCSAQALTKVERIRRCRRNVTVSRYRRVLQSPSLINRSAHEVPFHDIERTAGRVL